MKNLEKEIAEITKELVELHYFFMHQMLKENKIKRLNTFRDWMYSISGNTINPTIVTNCKILIRNIEDFSLKNKHLNSRAKKLLSKAENIKADIYKLPPIKRGLVGNKDWAKMFTGKHRKIFDNAFNKKRGK